MPELSLQTTSRHAGFTLIELSIVLVIIGLIIGGILTGQDLINASTIRAQLSQIEKYNTAVRTFQGKYGFLPGDIPNPYATNFGFKTRGLYAAEGNGDGVLQGQNGNSATNSAGNEYGNGELVMFWVDLSTAGLIDSTFSTATSATAIGVDVTGTAVGNYFPSAKIGAGNYVYVWSGGTYGTGWNYNGIHYYGISLAPTIGSSSLYGKIASGAPGMTVAQAYNIDKKMDDGLPQSGNVTAVYLHGVSGDPLWTDGVSTLYYPPSTSAVTASTTTCMDNGGNAGPRSYSMSKNGGGGTNCGLSFQFQ